MLDDYRCIEHDWLCSIYRYLRGSRLRNRGLECVARKPVRTGKFWLAYVVMDVLYHCSTRERSNGQIWFVRIPLIYTYHPNNTNSTLTVLLTYNLTALYAYSLSVRDDDHDDDEGGVNPSITEIALHRVVAVLSGCL